MKEKQTTENHSPNGQSKGQPAEPSSGQSKALSMLLSRLRDGTFGEMLGDWKWILAYSRRYRGAIFLYVVFGVLSSTLGLAGSVAGKYLIDAVTGFDTGGLLYLVLLTVGCALSGMLCGCVIDRLSAKLSVRICCDMQADLYTSVMEGDWMAVSRYPSGDLLNRFLQDTGTAAGNAVSWLPKLLISLYQFLATFCVILYYDPVMAVLALAAAPVLLLSSRYLMRCQRDYGQRVREESGNLSAFAAESFSGFDTVKSFGITALYCKKLAEKQKLYENISLDYQWFSMKTGVWMNLLGMVVQYAAFGYCLWRLWSGDITFGTMTLFLQQRSSLTSAFNAVVGMVPTFLSASVSAHRVKELMELPQECKTIHAGKADKSETIHVSDKNGSESLHKTGITVTLSGIDFSYEENHTVIASSSMYAAPGEIIALIGASGEGKTTLIRLMLGLVHAQDGSITLTAEDGTVLCAGADTRALISYVPQGNTVFSGTIADNLRMVKEDADDGELIAALKAACAWEFVSAMDGGLYARVGERGRGLSEGQAQRIALARALLRDAPVLLLDEATSALDVATERRVLRTVMERSPGKTVILTTHRPTVLGMCNRVYRVMGTEITVLSEELSAEMAMEF